ncbi:MAG TPA: sulfite exporter TauE/SafE family protein [Thermoanaerobaculia bacterium]|nr:sulfite exporter TauE/SafE family protein [Thermoanaerobaculia bacterium]
MEFLVLGGVALVVSALTLFSGFGLGTLLMPAFAIFFPLEIAIPATAVVHMANSYFKVAVLGTEARRSVVIRFGLPAVALAFVGAWLLRKLAGQDPLFRYEIGGHVAETTPIQLVMGLLILCFAAMDLIPYFTRLKLDPKLLPLGGAVSGFFGGLSGHQGALRAAFLGKIGLTPTEFAATQGVLAALVDTARMIVYVLGFTRGELGGVQLEEQWALVAFASACAFAGVLIGRKLLPKMTLERLHWITGGLLLIVGAGLLSGLI